MAIDEVKPALMQNVGRASIFGAVYPVAWYNVRTSGNTGANQILEYFRDGANNLPWVGDAYNYQGDTIGSATYCAEVEVQKHNQRQGKNEWQVSCRYAPIEDFPFITSAGFITQDPLLMKPDYKFAMAQFQEEATTAYFRRFWYYDDSNPPVPVEYTDPANFSKSFPTEVIGRLTPPGNKISPVNSAGDPVDPPLQRDRSDLVLQVIINLAGYDMEQATLFQDAVNNSPVELDLTGTVYGGRLRLYPHQMKVNNITADWMQTTFASKYSGAYQAPVIRNYWRHVYEIHIRRGIEFPDPATLPAGHRYPTGWIDSPVCQGFNASAQEGEPDGAGGTIGTLEDGEPGKRRLTDKDGTPISEPSLLQVDGQPLKQTAGGGGTLRNKPRHIDYQKYEELDFTDLPLGFGTWDPQAP